MWKRLLLVPVLLALASVARLFAADALSPSDYLAIQRLYATYNMTIDSGDAEGWAATFVPDGVFNKTNKGHDMLVQFVKDWREKRNGDKRRHANSNLIVTPTTSGAKASIYLLLLDTSARPVTIALTGVYDDELVKTPAGWKFKTRVLNTDGAR
jgi:hypothetical protein